MPEAAPTHQNERSECWCGRGDSNPHVLANASPSSWCVCQFRHFRKEGRFGQLLSINQKAAEQTASAATVGVGEVVAAIDTAHPHTNETTTTYFAWVELPMNDATSS